MTQPNNQSDARMTRGAEIAEKGRIAENPDGSLSVPSQTREGVFYGVRAFGQAWTCDCPDFVNRCDSIEACKHIVAARLWTAARVEIQSKLKPKVFAEDTRQCGHCGSVRVVRYGHSDGKQVFKCRDCGRKFRDSLLAKSRYSPEMISLTLGLYFSNNSLLNCRTLGSRTSCS